MFKNKSIIYVKTINNSVTKEKKINENEKAKVL